jgi:hypothetical protein
LRLRRRSQKFRWLSRPLGLGDPKKCDAHKEGNNADQKFRAHVTAPSSHAPYSRAHRPEGKLIGRIRLRSSPPGKAPRRSKRHRALLRSRVGTADTAIDMTIRVTGVNITGLPGYLVTTAKAFVLSTSDPPGSVNADTAAWLATVGCEAEIGRCHCASCPERSAARRRGPAGIRQERGEAPGPNGRRTRLIGEDWAPAPCSGKDARM